MSISHVNAYAALDRKSPLQPLKITRRAAGPRDVQIEILYCGVCHSDIHSARNEWGGAVYPLVPGHEIVGRVTQVGVAVTRYRTGDLVGVGCLVDSCRACSACAEGLEQYCEGGSTFTYNSPDKHSDRQTTYGGYSTHIVVNEDFVLRVPANLPLDKAAPLLCAGITTYSPLRHWKVGAGHTLGVIGLGGLGHMAVKIAVAMGAKVSVLSHSQRKAQDALAFGAVASIDTSSSNAFATHANRFDFLLNTVSADIDLNQYLGLLKRGGTMIQVGAPEKPTPLGLFSLITQRRSLAGSLIGGIAETQEMLDFCGKHNITPEIEVISMQAINDAYERMIKGDVRYRFVIDMQSLKTPA